MKIRRQAQIELFSVLTRYRFSFQIIVNRIVELLNKSNEVDHDQIKVGYLYFLRTNAFRIFDLSRVVCMFFTEIMPSSYPLKTPGQQWRNYGPL